MYRCYLEPHLHPHFTAFSDMNWPLSTMCIARILTSVGLMRTCEDYQFYTAMSGGCLQSRKLKGNL
jgi:hypothetical protein